VHSYKDTNVAMDASIASLAAPVGTAATSPPPLEGISLAGFQALFDAHGGRAAFEGLTTDDVKKNFVLPATQARRCAYVELLRATPACVARANAFASHAYGYTFVDSVDALAAWQERHPEGGYVPYTGILRLTWPPTVCIQEPLSLLCPQTILLLLRPPRRQPARRGRDRSLRDPP
jgi:hypothetical protein